MVIKAKMLTHSINEHNHHTTWQVKHSLKPNTVTCTMAGSWGREQLGFGGSHTVRSLMSLPLKMMYSKTSSRGATGLSVGRSSVPKDFTVHKNRSERGKQTVLSLSNS